jgi:hypothetical protein
MEKRLESLIAKSIPISGTSGVERYDFFQILTQKIEKLANKIKAGKPDLT